MLHQISLRQIASTWYHGKYVPKYFHVLHSSATYHRLFYTWDSIHLISHCIQNPRLGVCIPYQDSRCKEPARWINRLKKKIDTVSLVPPNIFPLYLPVQMQRAQGFWHLVLTGGYSRALIHNLALYLPGVELLNPEKHGLLLYMGIGETASIIDGYRVCSSL